MKDSKQEKKAPDSPTNTSTLYCDPDANVTFVSADGIRFKLHSRYFTAVSAGFSAPESTSVNDQPVVLTESAKVLELLFQFIHPPSGCEHFRQPSVMKMNVNLFFQLATAAGKYVVYAAMNVCITRMHYELYSSYPIQVLNHSANHGYDELSDKAAPQTMSLSNPLQDTLKGLTDPRVAVKWMKYYGHWLEVPKIADGLSFVTVCPRYAELLFGFLRNMTLNPTRPAAAVKTPIAICNTNLTTCLCKIYNEIYIRQLLDLKIVSIPKFSKIT